jgi:hypothetical protein
MVLANLISNSPTPLTQILKSQSPSKSPAVSTENEPIPAHERNDALTREPHPIPGMPVGEIDAFVGNQEWLNQFEAVMGIDLPCNAKFGE